MVCENGKEAESEKAIDESIGNLRENEKSRLDKEQKPATDNAPQITRAVASETRCRIQQAGSFRKSSCKSKYCTPPIIPHEASMQAQKENESDACQIATSAIPSLMSLRIGRIPPPTISLTRQSIDSDDDVRLVPPQLSHKPAAKKPLALSPRIPIREEDDERVSSWHVGVVVSISSIGNAFLYCDVYPDTEVFLRNHMCNGNLNIGDWVKFKVDVIRKRPCVLDFVKVPALMRTRINKKTVEVYL